MNKLFKKLILSTASIGAIATPIATVVSCGQDPEKEKPFSVGVSMAPVSTLNYIKYKSAVDVSSTIVESLFKAGPTMGKPLHSALALPKADLIDANGFLELSARGYQTGTLRRFEYHPYKNGYGRQPDSNRPDPVYTAAIARAKSEIAMWTDNYSSCQNLTVNLNGKSEWANGDKLTSSNFIDGLAYILDINTGSQRLKDVLDIGIKNAKEFIEAQNAYAREMGSAYQNPFGYIEHPLPADATEEAKKNWAYEVQRTGQFPTQKGNSSKERALVDAIEKAAKHLGIFGDAWSSHPEPADRTGNKWGDDQIDLPSHQIEIHAKKSSTPVMPVNQNGSKPLNVAMNPYKLNFVPEFNMDTSVFAMTRIAGGSKNIMPVNRAWIQANGGIEDFGKDEKHILAEGPFKIKESVLGVNGFILLERNEKYHAVREILPKTVKIFFQTDPVVLGSLFNDGYIVETNIDSIYTKKFFSDMTKRNLIKKFKGWGGTGYVFNLDKETNKNKALLDPHFRKSILFATNRTELVKVSGFDTTEASYSMIEPSTGLESWMGDNNAITQGTSHSSERIQYSKDFSAPMMSTDGLQETGISQLFANSKLKDELYNVEEARKEIALFKKANPGTKSVNVKFIHDGSAAMINIALALKSQIKTAFGDFVTLDINGLPKSIYDDYLLRGNFDMTWRNLDWMINNIPMASGVDGFFSPDGIEKSNAKTIGFQTNPAGSWTVSDAFQYYKDTNTEDEVKTRLNIPQNIWNKIKDLGEIPKALKDSNISSSGIKFIMNKRLSAFFAKRPMDTTTLDPKFPDSLKTDWANLDVNFDTSTEIAPLVVAVNKIIMDQAVIVPTFRVDVIVRVDRLPSILWKVAAPGFSYVYDLLRKPRPTLPGIEVKGA